MDIFEITMLQELSSRIPAKKIRSIFLYRLCNFYQSHKKNEKLKKDLKKVPMKLAYRITFFINQSCLSLMK